MAEQIFLSPPWVDEKERLAIAEAFDSGYVAPCGPQVDAFENEVATIAERKYAVAVSSGTAAIDLAMAEFGVNSEWTVLAPTLTFIATVGPAYHRGAKIIFIDCDETGNMDVALLEKALREKRKESREAKILVVGVDLYGRCCSSRVIANLCREMNAKFLMDSAESVGARDEMGRPSGSTGDIAIFSFNGNKIITTSGGGAFLTNDPEVASRARSRSQQSREKAIWYEHREVGYNYRMSNLLASLGRAQLKKLPEILAKRRDNYLRYRELVNLLPDVVGENHWLNVAILKSREDRDKLISKFASAKIESRPVWKPLHLQPVFANAKVYGGAVAENLFARGICLPSGTGLTEKDFSRIANALS